MYMHVIICIIIHIPSVTTSDILEGCRVASVEVGNALSEVNIKHGGLTLTSPPCIRHNKLNDFEILFLCENMQNSSRARVL